MKNVYAIILISKTTKFLYCLGVYDNELLAKTVATNQSILKNMNYQINTISIPNKYQYLFVFLTKNNQEVNISFNVKRLKNRKDTKIYYFKINNDKTFCNKKELDVLHQTMDNYDAESKQKLKQIVFLFYSK